MEECDRTLYITRWWHEGQFSYESRPCIRPILPGYRSHCTVYVRWEDIYKPITEKNNLCETNVDCTMRRTIFAVSKNIIIMNTRLSYRKINSWPDWFIHSFNWLIVRSICRSVGLLARLKERVRNCMVWHSRLAWSACRPLRTPAVTRTRPWLIVW